MILSLLATVLPVVLKIIDKAVPDQAAAAKIKLRIIELQNEANLKQLETDLQMAVGQLKVNEAEAQSGSLYVAGWRPFIGWSFSICIVLMTAVLPIASSIAGTLGYTLVVPDIDYMAMISIITGMLGLGGMRSFDKMIARKYLDKADLYDTIRQRFGSLSQDDVDAIEKALIVRRK